MTDKDERLTPALSDDVGELVARLRARTVPGDVDYESLGYAKKAIRDPLCQEAADAIAELEAEIEQLRDYAREVSKALVGLSGGGSEMFIHIQDDFYADPKACRERIESKIATGRCLTQFKAKRSRP